ncbi:MAG: hypothetical protein GY830_02690 [Bacteroidetes bacterium]|nr:hypothetical protein [Bacteroidota bacterium]
MKVILYVVIFSINLINCSQKSKDLQISKNYNQHFNIHSVFRDNKINNYKSGSWFLNSNSTFKKLLTICSLFSFTKSQKLNESRELNRNLIWKDEDILLCKNELLDISTESYDTSLSKTPMAGFYDEGFVLIRDYTSIITQEIKSNIIDNSLNLYQNSIKINKNILFENAYNFDVTTLLNNYYLVVWSNGTNYKIFAKLLSKNGTIIKNTFQISSKNESLDLYPTTTTLNNGNIIIAWHNKKIKKIQFIILDKNANIKTNIFNSTDFYGKLLTGGLNRVDIAHSEIYNYFIIIYRSPNPPFPIKYAIYDEYGILKNESLLYINSSAYNRVSGIRDTEKYVIAAYSDLKIFFSILDKNGKKIISEIIENTNSVTSIEVNTLNRKYFIISYFDIIKHKLLAQIYDELGNKIGKLLNIYTSKSSQIFPSIATLSNSDFVIGFYDNDKNLTLSQQYCFLDFCNDCFLGTNQSYDNSIASIEYKFNKNICFNNSIGSIVIKIPKCSDNQDDISIFGNCITDYFFTNEYFSTKDLIINFNVSLENCLIQNDYFNIKISSPFFDIVGYKNITIKNSNDINNSHLCLSENSFICKIFTDNPTINPTFLPSIIPTITPTINPTFQLENTTEYQNETVEVLSSNELADIKTWKDGYLILIIFGLTILGLIVANFYKYKERNKIAYFNLKE